MILREHQIFEIKSFILKNKILHLGLTKKNFLKNKNCYIFLQKIQQSMDVKGCIIMII